MSADLKKEIIPKMKANLTEMMNRNEATLRDVPSISDPLEEHFRSMSDRLKAKLRPVPSRRAVSARVLSQRLGGHRTTNEEELDSITPQAEGEKSGAILQVKGENGSSSIHTDDAGRISSEVALAATCEGEAAKWDRQLTNPVLTANSSATTQITASTFSDAASPTESESMPTTVVPGHIPRRSRGNGRFATLPRRSRPSTDEMVTPLSSLPSSPPSLPSLSQTSVAPLAAASSFEDFRPPLPKITISRGRNGVVHKKLVYNSEIQFVPSEVNEQVATAATQDDRSDGTKARRRFRTRKAIEAEWQSVGDENWSEGRCRRRRRNQRIKTPTATDVLSTAEEAATVSHLELESERHQTDKCVVHKISSGLDTSAATTKGSNQLRDSSSTKGTVSSGRLGRGRCGRKRRACVTVSARTIRTIRMPLILAVRRYARLGRVPQDWPARTEKTDGCFCSDSVSEPSLDRGIIECETSEVAANSVKIEELVSGPAVPKPETESDVQKRRPGRAANRAKGSRRLSTSLGAVKMREYRARRQAMGGQPLGYARKRCIENSAPTGASATDGSSSSSTLANMEKVTHPDGTILSISMPLEGTASDNEGCRAEAAGDKLNPPETVTSSPLPVTELGHRRRCRGRKSRVLSRTASDRPRYQRVNRYSHGLQLDGRSRGIQGTMAVPDIASEFSCTSGDAAANAESSNVSQQTTKEGEAVTVIIPESVPSESVKDPESTFMNEAASSVNDSFASTDSILATKDSASAVTDPTMKGTDETVVKGSADTPPGRERRGPRKLRGSGKPRRFPAGETLTEFKRRMELLRAGRAPPLPRGRPVGPILRLKRFLKTGWEPLCHLDMVPTPEEDNRVWETVMEVSTDVDGDYGETFTKLDGVIDCLYKSARAAQEVKDLIEMENELGAGDSFSETFFPTLPENTVGASRDPIAGEKTGEQPRKVLRVRSLEEPERSVHIAYRGERGEQVDVIDGFRFVSFSSASSMARFTRREVQQARRLRRKERRKANRRAFMAQMKAERAERDCLYWRSAVGLGDPDWDPFLDLSDTELHRTKLPELDRSSSSPSSLDFAPGEDTTLEFDEFDSFEMSELPISETLATASTAPDQHSPGRGRGRGRSRGRPRGRPRGSRSATGLLRSYRPFVRKRQVSGASSSTMDVDMEDNAAATHAIIEGLESEPSRSDRGHSCLQNPYERIKRIAREAFALTSQLPGPHPRVEHDPALAERLKALAAASESSGDSGIFSSPDLDDYLRDHGALKVSFSIPGLAAAASVVRTASPPPTASQKRIPPLPPRPQAETGEPRCRTALERLAWLGYRSKEELEEGRQRAAKQLADAAEKTKTAEPDADLKYVPVSAVLRPRYRPVSPRGQHVPFVSRTGRLLPLSGVTDRSLAERRAWDLPQNARGTSLYAYDQHHQLLIRGSQPRNERSAPPQGRGCFNVGISGRTVRPETVERRVNAWHDCEYRVDTVPVDCIMAQTAASAVCTDPKVRAAAARKSTSRMTKGTRRRMTALALGQRLNEQIDAEKNAGGEGDEKGQENEGEKKGQGSDSREEWTEKQEPPGSGLGGGKAAAESYTGAAQLEGSAEAHGVEMMSDEGVNTSGVEVAMPDHSAETRRTTLETGKDVREPVVEVFRDQLQLDKGNGTNNEQCSQPTNTDEYSSRLVARQETTEAVTASENNPFMEGELNKRMSRHTGSTEGNAVNIPQAAAENVTQDSRAIVADEGPPSEVIGCGYGSDSNSPAIQSDRGTVGDSKLVINAAAESDDGEGAQEIRLLSPGRESEAELSGDDFLIGSVRSAHMGNDSGASADEMNTRTITVDPGVASSTVNIDRQESPRVAEVVESSMGTDGSPHKTQSVGKQPPIKKAVSSSASAKYRREMLRLGVCPPQRSDVCISSRADQGTLCPKEFCRLGCVCSSLTCGRPKREHCGREECMLTCSCTEQLCNVNSLEEGPTPASPTSSGYNLPPFTASSNAGTFSSVAGSRAKRARKIPIRFTQHDVHYEGPLALMAWSDDTPPARSPPRFTLPSNLPRHDEDVLDMQYDQLMCEVKVHVPVYRLPRIESFCLVHQVHACEKYSRGGSCYQASRNRLQQLGRNVALRSHPLPPTVSRRRHDHTARTFARRIERKPLDFLPQQDSFCLAGAVYEGAQTPRLPIPPPRECPILALPGPVSIRDVACIVSIEPVGTDGKTTKGDERHRHHAVRLHNGMMNVLSESPMPPGVTWRVQPANDVAVIDSSGRQFRNPSEGLSMAQVAFEGNVGQLRRVPLVTLNHQVKLGRSRLASYDGGVVFFPNKRPLRGEDATLHRVDMKTHKIHDNGMVVLRHDTAGVLSVIGVVEAAAEEKEWEAEAARILCGLRDGVKRSTAVRAVLNLLEIRNAIHIGATDAPLLPITVNTVAKTTAKAYRVIKPSASDARREVSVTSQAPVGTPPVMKGSEKPRLCVAVSPGGQVRAFPADSDKSAQGDAQSRVLPSSEPARKRVVSDEPPRVRLHVEAGKVVAMTQERKRATAVKAPLATEPTSRHPAKTQLKVAVKGDHAAPHHAANFGNSAPHSASVGLPPPGHPMGMGAGEAQTQTHVAHATVSGVCDNRQADPNAALTTEPTTGKSQPEKVIVSIQRRERDALRRAIIAAKTAPTEEKVPSTTSRPALPQLSVPSSGQPTKESTDLSASVNVIRGKRREVRTKDTSAQVLVKSNSTSIDGGQPPVQPSRPTSSKVPTSSSTPTDSSRLAVPLDPQPSDPIQTASQGSSQIQVSSNNRPSRPTKRPKGVLSSPGGVKVVTVTTVNGVPFVQKSGIKPSSLVANSSVAVPSTSSKDVREPNLSDVSKETGTPESVSASKEPQLTSRPREMLGPRANHKETPVSTNISRTNKPLVPSSSSKREGFLHLPSVSKSGRPVKGPLQFRVVSAPRTPPSSKDNDASKRAPASKKPSSYKPGLRLGVAASLSESTAMQQPASGETPSARVTVQQSPNQISPNSKDLPSGARLSFVRSPPQRVKGRMVSARFSGKPSRWNMIELSTLPDLMHVDGISISLTKRYLKHAVHQVKNTRRPVSTRVNGVLVTIVWMPHLPDFVFLGPVVREQGSGAKSVTLASGDSASSTSDSVVAKPAIDTTEGAASIQRLEVSPSSATKAASNSTSNIVVSLPKLKNDPSPSAATTSSTVVITPLTKTEAEAVPPPVAVKTLSQQPAVSDVGDPLALPKELSMTPEPLGAAADASRPDDDILVLPPPAPRAPLDVILLDNSDISDDELLLDTNAPPPPTESTSCDAASPSTSGAASSGHLLAGLLSTPGVRRVRQTATNITTNNGSQVEAPTVTPPARRRPSKAPRTSPSGKRRPQPADEVKPFANSAFEQTGDSPRPKRRKQEITERIGSCSAPELPSGLAPPLRGRGFGTDEYYAAKRSLEGLLFGRLENATPIKRRATLVVNAAATEIKAQRSRHSQLKVRLWQLSQKQRNLLGRLNRLLSELPLEKRIEKIAEIEDLLSFLQVRVEGDDLEPEMLLERKVSQQPSQFRVIADGGAADASEPGAPDAEELSEM